MRWMKSESGQSIVEFALVLPMLLVVCIGMAELGRATWAWNMAQMAAAEGARRAIVIGSQELPNGNTVYAWKDSVDAGVKSILYGRDQKTENMLASGVTITKTLNKADIPYVLSVDVGVPVQLIIYWGPKGSGTYTIHGRASMPVQPAFSDG
ncbi:MAG TPA: TadE/TadG family type IV pilus assembly protein [Candidatus Eisenbacteria bacterium]|nr:TadE/TadG family type IV pilus assembly protein [Candidatus Eisenbacteria bacterium]